MARFPVKTSLPGLAGVQVTLDPNGSGVPEGFFEDKAGKKRTFSAAFSPIDGVYSLIVSIDQVPRSEFRQWKAHPNYWSATGLTVPEYRVGLALATYEYVRQILARGGSFIAPSENLLPDGRALWASLDPKVVFEQAEADASRPNLTGLSPP